MEELIGQGLARKGSRAVAPDNPGAAALRSARVAARFDKRVVWVEGLNTAGLTFRGLDRGVIFLDPDSGRSAQVLTAHELAHHLAGENQQAFEKLAQALPSEFQFNMGCAGQAHQAQRPGGAVTPRYWAESSSRYCRRYSGRTQSG